MRQMKLSTFLREYDMSLSTTKRLIHRENNPLPAFKIGRDWYVDTGAYERWRKEEHRANYKYA